MSNTVYATIDVVKMNGESKLFDVPTAKDLGDVLNYVQESILKGEIQSCKVSPVNPDSHTIAYIWNTLASDKDKILATSDAVRETLDDVDDETKRKLARYFKLTDIDM
jgi:hypothetical protein